MGKIQIIRDIVKKYNKGTSFSYSDNGYGVNKKGEFYTFGNTAHTFKLEDKEIEKKEYVLDNLIESLVYDILYDRYNLSYKDDKEKINKIFSFSRKMSKLNSSKEIIKKIEEFKF